MRLLTVACLAIIALAGENARASILQFSVDGSGAPVNPPNSLVISGTVGIDTTLGTLVSSDLVISDAGIFDGTYDIVGQQGTVSVDGLTSVYIALTGPPLPGDQLLLVIDGATLVGFNGGKTCFKDFLVTCSEVSGVTDGHTGFQFSASISPVAAPEPSTLVLIGAVTAVLSLFLVTCAARRFRL